MVLPVLGEAVDVALGVVDGPVLRNGLGEHEDHDDFEAGGGHYTPGTEPTDRKDADEGGHHQLADEHHQEHRVEEALGILRQADQHLCAPFAVVGQALGLCPRHSHECGFGQGQQGRNDQEHHDDHGQCHIFGPEDCRNGHDDGPGNGIWR